MPNRCWLAALALVWLPCAAAQIEPAPLICPPSGAWPRYLRLEYDVTATRSVLSVDGTSVLTMERDSDRYRLQLSLDATGIYHAEQRSRGRLEGGTLQPEKFDEQRTRRPALSVAIDWAAKRVSFAANNSSAPTQPRLQDRLSLLMQLTRDLRAQPAADFLEIPVAGRRDISLYRLTRRGAETLALPYGRIEAVRLERPADEDNDRIEAWYAQTVCWMPVRVRYTDRKGGVIDNRLHTMKIE